MLADRVRRLAPSATLAVTARAQALRAQGVDVISFGAGEPDFDTPERIKDAAIRALRAGKTKYTDAAGIPELRAAVSAALKRDQGLDYSPDQVLISVGAKHSLYNLSAALFQAGDEVLIPSPYWVTYPEQVRLVDATPVFVPTDESTGFELDPDRIRKAVTPRTRALILNSPNNPTGAVFGAESLKAIAALAVERDLWVISDECYAALSYEGSVPSIAALGPEVQARTIVVNTCSKAYAMTGWRIGYAAGPRPIVKAMADFQSQCTSNPTSIAMWAAIEALTGPQEEVAAMAAEFDRRRHAIVTGLNAIAGIRCVMPKGAFYAFPNVSGLFGRRFKGQPLRSSADVAACLLEAGRVAVVPGLDFGADHYVRLSYATSLSLIREGLDRIARVVGGLEE